MSQQSNESTMKYLTIGDVVRLRLPYSEVCMHLQVAGKVMNVQLVGTLDHPGAQILHDDRTHLSFPILPGEAGIYTEYSPKRYYCYEAQNGDG